MKLTEISQKFENPSPALIEKFKISAEKIDAELLAVSDVSEFESALLKYTEKYHPVVCFEPGLLGKYGLVERLSKRDIKTSTNPLDSEISVTTALFGIADTGSVFIDTTDEFIRKISALVKTHLVILNPKFIVPTLYEGFEIIERLSAEKDNFCYSIISGPSRTADIERVLTLGVHGPKKLVVLLWENFESS